MKICMVRTYPEIIRGDSYNIQELGLAKELRKHNIQTDIVMSGGRLSNYSTEEYDGVTIYRLPCIQLPGYQGLFISIFSFLREKRYDLIQVHDDTQIFTCLIAFWAHKRKVPVVLYQGVYRNYEGFIPALCQRIYDLTFLKLLEESVSLSIAKTSDARDYLVAKKFNRDIVIAPVGLDVQKFNEQTTINWKSKLGLNENLGVLLYVGKIYSRRNTRFLIEVFMEVYKETKAYLIIAGDGPDKSLCEDMVREYKMENYIRFIGKVPQSQILSLYKAASLFLLPSRYEIYGMIVLESMYCGVPVISSATAGPKAIIRNGHDGVIINDFSVDTWKREIVFLLNNSEARKRYAMNAQEKIMNLLTWPVIAKRYADIYKTIVTTGNA